MIAKSLQLIDLSGAWAVKVETHQHFDAKLDVSDYVGVTSEHTKIQHNKIITVIKGEGRMPDKSLLIGPVTARKKLPSIEVGPTTLG